MKRSAGYVCIVVPAVADPKSQSPPLKKIEEFFESFFLAKYVDAGDDRAAPKAKAYYPGWVTPKALQKGLEGMMRHVPPEMDCCWGLEGLDLRSLMRQLYCRRAAVEAVMPRTLGASAGATASVKEAKVGAAFMGYLEQRMYTAGADGEQRSMFELGLERTVLVEGRMRNIIISLAVQVYQEHGMPSVEEIRSTRRAFKQERAAAEAAFDAAAFQLDWLLTPTGRSVLSTSANNPICPRGRALRVGDALWKARRRMAAAAQLGKGQTASADGATEALPAGEDAAADGEGLPEKQPGAQACSAHEAAAPAAEGDALGEVAAAACEASEAAAETPKPLPAQAGASLPGHPEQGHTESGAAAGSPDLAAAASPGDPDSQHRAVDDGAALVADTPTLPSAPEPADRMPPVRPLPPPLSDYIPLQQAAPPPPASAGCALGEEAGPQVPRTCGSPSKPAPALPLPCSGSGSCPSADLPRAMMHAVVGGPMPRLSPSPPHRPAADSTEPDTSVGVSLEPPLAGGQAHASDTPAPVTEAHPEADARDSPKAKRARTDAPPP